MLSELEKKLLDGLKDVAEKCFGKIETFTPLKKTEVFFMIYKSLAVLLERDFDLKTELEVTEIIIKPKEDVIPNNTKITGTSPRP